ncbi:septal ring lytic transglycosylase RlpA family protein [Candidatus Peregrinibacteria bacterium]|nr:septal ring lytic transglycosylase RlpA family protein [Candidatus Peregrinibacteria bacterium]
MKKITAISFFVAAFLTLNQPALAIFTDVATNYKYYDAITYLQDSGTIEGYEDGSYRPDATVNRAEALKIILLGSDVLVPEIAEQDIFPDVPYGTWYGKYVAKAKNLGIVHGDDDSGLFRPGDTINLAEIVKILLETNNIEPIYEMSRRPYADVPTEEWFAPYFAYADSVHLLEEDENYNVFPATEVTRGLMAQLMYQLHLKPEGYQEGKATFYGSAFHGKGTASGEVFDASLFTAAHRTLPFGTWLRVKNLANGLETYVRVNDRGPYGDDSRIIDLSKAAFESIASLGSGIINVSITPVSGPPGGIIDSDSQALCPGIPTLDYYSGNIFENITLNTSLANVYLADEVFFVEGKSASSEKTVSAFLADDSESQFPFYTERSSDGSFSIPVYFPQTGDYSFGVLPGESGSSIVETISVLPSSCLTQSENNDLPTPTDLKLSIDQGDLVVRWTQNASHNVSRVRFTQGARQKEYFLRGKTELIPHYRHFEGWQAGTVDVQVRSGTLTGHSFLEDGSIQWSPPVSYTFNADTHHQYIVEPESVGVIDLPNVLKSGSSLTLKVDPKVNLAATGYVILPSGQVEDIPLASPTHTPTTGNYDTKVFPSSASDVRLTYRPLLARIHFFEINDEQGIAAVNIPVYPEGIYPLLPNPSDLASLKRIDLGSDFSAIGNEMLRLVNADRAAYGLPPLNLNDGLTKLAQARSDDMATRDYFGHWNPEGMTANDLRKNYAIQPFVSENIARDVSAPLAEYGLMRSATHRSNILNPEWQRIGLGVSDDENGTLFVQIFSDNPIYLSDVAGLRTEIVSALNANRNMAISLNENLNSLSQSWADKWVSEKWCDIKDDSCNPLTAPGSTFTSTLQENGIVVSLGAYYRGDSSFDSAKDAIAENAGLLDPRWKKIGLGIHQDNLGLIHLVVAYTE